MLLVMGISFLTYSFISKDKKQAVEVGICNCPPGYQTKTIVGTWQTIQTYPNGLVKQQATFRCSNGPDFDVLMVCYRTGPYAPVPCC